MPAHDALQAILSESLNSQRKSIVNERFLAFRSIFLHAWDLADDGVDHVLEEIRNSGLNTICLAGNYHSGWFIHPQHSRHRTFMTEGSVFYFRPQTALYKQTRLKPRVSALCKHRDWFAMAGKKLKSHDLQLVSWTIGTHNSYFGSLYPELTQRNVYGDRLPHVLCPANEEVIVYLQALCRDLATNHPVWALQLECFDWMSLRHGHHHERDLIGLTDLESQLLSICVCSACSRRATGAGVDIAGAKAKIKELLDTTFREAPQRPPGHPRTMAQAERRISELKALNEWRRQYRTAIIASIRSESLRQTDCRLLLETGFDENSAHFVDGFACAAYQQSPKQTRKICRTAHQSIPKSWRGLMQCLIQLGMGVPRNEKELHGIVTEVADSGCHGINFYNRSESPPKMLRWLAAVMKDFVE